MESSPAAPTLLDQTESEIHLAGHIDPTNSDHNSRGSALCDSTTNCLTHFKTLDGQRSHFPFMSLAPEIRVMIYKEYFKLVRD